MRIPQSHKHYQENLPIGFTGRPIIPACNSYTENISKYNDYNLQPCMKNLPSYVKDITDFICKIKSVPKLLRNSSLVTLNVSSLYTNIPHEDEKEACEEKSISELSPDEIYSRVKLTLENNYFQFFEQFLEKYEVCKDQELKQSETKSSLQNKNGKYLTKTISLQNNYMEGNKIT